MFLCIHNAWDRHVTVGCLFKKHAFFCCSFFFSLNNLYFSITVSIYSITVSQLVSWYFEPSQPQVIKIRAKKQCSVCLLFALHAGHQTANYPKTTKSVMTLIYRKHTETSNTKCSKN